MVDPDKHCDLCHGTSFELICRQDRRGQPLETVMCLGCGLVQHAKFPTNEELSEYYANQYRLDYHGERRPSNRRVWRAWQKGERLVRQLRPFLTPGMSVFEVGAGLGCNIKAFELKGFHAKGVEPSVEFQDFSRSQLKAHVIRTELGDLQLPTPVDLVLFVHVIEHLASPRQSLQAIHKLLRPGGYLYLECPSLGKLHANPAELFHYAHLHTFTPIPLLTLLGQCGFEVVQCFSNGIGQNHKFLLRRTPPCDLLIDPRGVEQTRGFLRRFRQTWHRFSLRYLYGRMRRISLYCREFAWSTTATQSILRRISQRANMMHTA